MPFVGHLPSFTSVTPHYASILYNGILNDSVALYLSRGAFSSFFFTATIIVSQILNR